MFRIAILLFASMSFANDTVELRLERRLAAEASEQFELVCRVNRCENSSVSKKDAHLLARRFLSRLPKNRGTISGRPLLKWSVTIDGTSTEGGFQDLIPTEKLTAEQKKHLKAINFLELSLRKASGRGR